MKNTLCGETHHFEVEGGGVVTLTVNREAGKVVRLLGHADNGLKGFVEWALLTANLALKSGVPAERIADKWRHMRFGPEVSGGASLPDAFAKVIAATGEDYGRLEDTR